MSTIYDLTMKAISGDAVDLARYRDEVLLIVNLASQ